MAHSTIAEAVRRSIREYVESKGGEVYGDPVSVGNAWEAVVAVTPSGPLVVMEFTVSMGTKVDPAQGNLFPPHP